MQMSGALHQLPANKSPPTPMVQTPVIDAASAVPPVFPGTATPTSNQTSPVSAAISPPAAEPSTPSKESKAPEDGHNRTVSQSSGTSSAPELVAINNSAINTTATTATSTAATTATTNTTSDIRNATATNSNS